MEYPSDRFDHQFTFLSRQRNWLWRLKLWTSACQGFTGESAFPALAKAKDSYELELNLYGRQTTKIILFADKNGRAYASILTSKQVKWQSRSQAGEAIRSGLWNQPKL